jgi:hypothetical protein
MNRSETAQLLTKIAAFDRRTIGEADVMAWHEILETYPLADCLDAVRAYFAETREWCMPSDVVQRVARARKERLYLVGEPQPNPAAYENDEGGQAYWTEVRALRELIASGAMDEQRKHDYETSGLPLADFLAGKPAIERQTRDLPDLSSVVKSA